MDVRFPVLDDFPGKEHPAGFAADLPGAEHVVPDGEIVLGREMLFDHLLHLFVAGHHDLADPAAFLRHVDAVFVEQFDAVELAVPGVDVLLLRGALRQPERLIEPAGPDPVEDRAEFAALRVIGVREEHRVRRPFPHLFRADVDVFRVGIDVKEQLGRVQDLVDRVDGMLSPDDREERHRIQDEQEGAGHPEKVAHHQVGRPGGLEFGQAVEHIERVSALLFDVVVDGDRELLKFVSQRDFDRFDSGAVLQQRLMVGETEIDEVPLVLDRLPDIGLHEQPELVEIGNTPYDIVAQTDVVQREVHFGDAAFDSVKCCHRLDSFPQKKGVPSL